MTTTTSSQYTTGDSDDRIELLRQRAPVVTFVITVVVIALIVLVQVFGVPSGWLVAGGVATIVIAVAFGAFA